VATDDLLTVRGLTVQYPGASRPTLAGVDLAIGRGECVAVTGPSGCGKSTLCRALLDLLPQGTRLAGEIHWQGHDLRADRTRWHRLRGCGIGLVFQDHRHALDPLRRIGDQVGEVAALHAPGAGGEANEAAVNRALERVQLGGVASGMARRLPHQLSGGQRQRANLAAALVADPILLLADEPTTALDLLVQRELIKLMRSLVDDDGLALLLVTHDRDLVARVADRTLELAPAGATVAPARPERSAVRTMPAALVARGLTVIAGEGDRCLLRGVDLTLRAGRALGVVGESGAGKTTLVRALAGWITPACGQISIEEVESAGMAARRRAVQLVSQDAAAALDPHQTALAAVREAARLVDEASTADDRARALLADLGLDDEAMRRRPIALSGGQRQRVQLARALAVRPRFLLADEPASSLDAERREQMLALLWRSCVARDMGLLVVSHDLAQLERICDEIVVIAAGVVLERYEPARHGGPRHPLACDLAAAAPACWGDDDPPPAPRPEPSPLQAVPPLDGCPHAVRCPLVEDECTRTFPALSELDDGRFLRCPVVASRAR
jgi:peptide/nickel transport system ATP-binding protein